MAWQKLYDEYMDWRLCFDFFCDACANVRRERKSARKARRVGKALDDEHVVSKLEIAKSWRRLYFRTLFKREL